MKTHSILIVDDDSDFLNSLQVILKQKSHTVYTAGTTEEAIRLFDQNTPEIILLDLIMEDADSGIQLCRKIREKNKTVKIYLLSSVGENLAENIDIKKIGFNGAIEKPIKPEELMELVNTGDK